MTPLRILSLAAVVLVSIPTAGFAVTGRDAEGNPNGTPGSLTAPTDQSMSGQRSSQAAAPRTGITVGPASQDQDANKKALQEKLTEDGYSQVHDVNFGPEGTSAKATKDGKEWLLVIDSHGKVLQQEK